MLVWDVVLFSEEGGIEVNTGQVITISILWISVAVSSFSLGVVALFIALAAVLATLFILEHGANKKE